MFIGRILVFYGDNRLRVRANVRDVLGLPFYREEKSQ